MPVNQRKPEPVKDPNLYLAAERTLLSWIRTGLSMMGFGFVVARFGLFLRELSAVNLARPANQTGISTNFGIALVALGVIVNAASAVRYLYLIRRLQAGDSLSRPSTLALALAAALSLIGGAVVYYLMII
jgi:putative membrane protein